MTYEDVNLQCADCGSEFVFTAGEQEFYSLKGLVNTPKRCTDCRKSKKHARGSRPKALYDVVCSECGIKTQVPFKPSEDRPVYCTDCYKNAKLAVN